MIAAHKARQETHLYRHFDKNGALLYVGISLSAVARLSQHRSRSNWFDSIARVEIEAFPTREAALKAERRAITEESPAFNVAGKKARRDFESALSISETDQVFYAAFHPLEVVCWCESAKEEWDACPERLDRMEEVTNWITSEQVVSIVYNKSCYAMKSFCDLCGDYRELAIDELEFKPTYLLLRGGYYVGGYFRGEVRDFFSSFRRQKKMGPAGEYAHFFPLDQYRAWDQRG